MIGPLVQGVLLVGVVYWYSKGMLTVINEYYRDEFKSYLAKNEKKNTFLKPKPASTESDDESSQDPSLDVDLSPKVEGLPDILYTQGNSMKRDGIVTRGFESSLENINNNNNNNNNNNDIIPLLSINNDLQKSEKNSNEDFLPPTIFSPTVEDSCNVQQLLDSRKFNYNSRLSKSYCKVTEEPILNPSAENKLDYEQITNQQVPINADASVMTVKTAPATEPIIAITTPTILVTSPTPAAQEAHDSSISTGNCPSKIGCYKKTSLSGTSANVRMSKQKYQIDSCPPRDGGRGTNRGGGSGADTNRITTIGGCRRKSVTEMVQFWSNLQDGGNK